MSAAVRRAPQIGDPFATMKVDIFGTQKRTYISSAPSRIVIMTEYKAKNFSVLLKRTFIDSIYV